jgi:hypothetical protein
MTAHTLTKLTPNRVSRNFRRTDKVRLRTEVFLVTVGRRHSESNAYLHT